MATVEERVDRLEHLVEDLAKVLEANFERVYDILLKNELLTKERFREWEKRFEKERLEWNERFERERKQREEERKRDWEEWNRKLEESLKKWNEKLEEERKQREEERKKDREEWLKKLEEERKLREEERKKDWEEWNRKLEEDFKKWNEKLEKERKEWLKKLEEEKRVWEEKFEKEKEIANKRWAEISDRLGTLVEDIVAPNIRTIAQKYFSCVDVEFEGIRVKKQNTIDKSKRREFDFIVVCEEVVVLNETKSKPRAEDVIKFAEFISSKKFFEYFPEYKNKKLIPVFSSIYLSEDIVNLLTKNGIYALAFKGSEMDLLNYSEVKKGFEKN
ncbi:hypothetical protein [Sulfurihydrogenibium azorense]|uniref:hypothetical protein n=1 Tax=Sulfurihydrogenibium azorense TaxID=309806 RepID=UPI002409B4E3|nr:hypothetical protein [Sulfurihydrogenibium azorense]MDM7273569.1 hypothetical protein [Sulfurihydrogenibium azorense]